ncbi:PREDICTED: protein ripply1 isoform X2 [Miniopterus natalensis]|uniref:protein ripply1 isoform X2 n=1 Tax=Miniopterus natalensis TaxID=291302 RepID=UPI0007A6FA05|nr:PREDICTED: protein ripply1 isoform X2 [Miniopterus natalensis]
MDPSVPTAAADPEPTLALSIAPALAQGPLELPGLLSPSPLPFPGQEVDGSERLFWPKSRSFDYLYSYGEILLQNFPVQATINLYEDSDSEEEDNCEEEDGDEEQEKKEADKKGPEGCLRILRSAPHRVTSHPPSPSLTCPS